MSDEYAARLELASTALTLLFLAEMCVKLLGLGCAGYWADRWNALDGSIVVISMVEMIATLLAAAGDVHLGFLRMLRMLRVLRVLRLMRSWTGLYRIVSSFLKALPQLSNMFVLMFLTMLIFSIMGMQLFGGRYDESVGYSREPCTDGRCTDDALQPLPRFHFDSFMPAMITTFVLLTGKSSVPSPSPPPSPPHLALTLTPHPHPHTSPSPLPLPSSTPSPSPIGARAPRYLWRAC